MKIMRCKKTFICGDGGRQRVVRKGEMFSSNDAVVQRFSSHFEPAEDYVSKRAEKLESKPVERATAEPGEKRTVGRPRKAPKTDELTPENAPKTAAEAEAAGVTLDEPKQG